MHHKFNSNKSLNLQDYLDLASTAFFQNADADEHLNLSKENNFFSLLSGSDADQFENPTAFDYSEESITNTTSSTITNENGEILGIQTSNSSYDYTSGSEDGFNIDLNLTGVGWSEELKEQAYAMADLLSTLIIEDIPDSIVEGQSIDDLSINIQTGPIDGERGTLGAAWIGQTNSETGFTNIGNIWVDIDDANRLLNEGRFDDLILHEMIHVLGFISTGDMTDTLVNESNQYIGTNGLEAFQQGINRGDYNSDHDLLINWETGMHWEQDDLALPQDELMTGTSDETNHLSTVTLAAIEDLGYQTLWGTGTFQDTSVVLDEITADWANTNEWAVI